MNDTTQTLVRSFLKIGAGMAVSQGMLNQSDSEIIVAGLVALAGVVWGVLHRTSGASDSPSKPGPRLTSGPLLIMAMAAWLAIFGTGCTTAENRRVIGGTAVGTKLGIQEDPVTGLYTLGLSRVQTSFMIVPAYFTNGVFVSPETVSSYEVQARNGVFGSAGGTFTFAVGTNSVGTLLGGAHYPINQLLTGSTNVGSLVPSK